MPMLLDSATEHDVRRERRCPIALGNIALRVDIDRHNVSTFRSIFFGRWSGLFARATPRGTEFDQDNIFVVQVLLEARRRDDRGFGNILLGGSRGDAAQKQRARNEKTHEEPTFLINE